MMIMGHYNMVSATSVIIININLHGKWKIQLKYDCLSLWHLPERSQCWWSSADDFNVFSSKISNFLAKILSKYLIFTINFLWNLVFCVLQIFKKKKPNSLFPANIAPIAWFGTPLRSIPPFQLQDYVHLQLHVSCGCCCNVFSSFISIMLQHIKGV